MLHKRFVSFCLSGLVALVLFGCEQDSLPTAELDTEDPLGTEIAVARKNSDTAVADQYIVVFNDNVADAPGLARRLVAQHNGSLRFTYQHALKGFSAHLPSQAVEALSRNPNVAYVEANREGGIVTTQNNATWGLDRVDQRDLPLSTTYTYNNNGAGTKAYVLDTGVRASHNEFGPRVSFIANGSNGNFVGDGHGSAEDCHGHGTHVAGIIGGSTWGVAKGVEIVAGRVVNCNGSGTVDMPIAAVDWITANAAIDPTPTVVNMSLGYGNVQSLRDAVENSIAAGVNYAVSAGNGNFAGIPQNACQESPGGAPNANTVGATDSSDREASFSNYGPCVDILGAGVSVTSAWWASDTATNTISGTSMSSPHVAGVIALYLDANPGASPAQVSSALQDNASLNKIKLHRRSRQNGTPNRLLYMGFIGNGGNTPPTAAFSYSATGLTVAFTDESTDSDGTVVSWSWDFGDGTASDVQHPSHTYAGDGTYTVVLTVTDDDNAPSSTSQDVMVSSGGDNGITLSATGYKVRGLQKADLGWSGATATDVDVYRDGSVIVTTANDGFYTDAINLRGGGSYIYKVCEAGTSTCSNDATVSF